MAGSKNLASSIPGTPANDIVLSMDNIHKQFGGNVVLDDISAVLKKGEMVLLRGNNGSGKTTLVNILTGNLEPDRGTIFYSANGHPERFVFPRPWWKSLNPKDHFVPEQVARQGVGRAWQDIRLFQSQDLITNLAAASPCHPGENPFQAILNPPGVKAYEQKITMEAEKRLIEMGLKQRMYAAADEVSLGQAKRASVARALQAGARILFFDEPFSGLDAEGIESISVHLKSLAREQQLTIVIIEHACHVQKLIDWVDSVWTITDGRLKMQTVEDVRKEMDGKFQGSVLDWVQALSAQRSGTLTETPLSGGAHMLSFRLDKTMPAGPILELDGLVIRRGKRMVIGGDRFSSKGFSLKLHRGEIIILQAPNGWGKTTILDAITGQVAVEKGGIRLNGKEIVHLPTWDRKRLGIRFLRSRNQLFPSLSVDETLSISNVSSLPEYIKPFSGRRVSTLSGGEQRKVAWACTVHIQPEPEVLLLDEPFDMLDDKTVMHLQALLGTLENAAVLVAVPNVFKS